MTLKTTRKFFRACSEGHIEANLSMFKTFAAEYDTYLKSKVIGPDDDVEFSSIEHIWRRLDAGYSANPKKFLNDFEKAKCTLPKFVSHRLMKDFDGMDESDFETQGLASGLTAMLLAKHLVEKTNAWADLKGHDDVNGALSAAPALPPAPTDTSDPNEDTVAVMKDTSTLAGLESVELVESMATWLKNTGNAEARSQRALLKVATQAAQRNPDWADDPVNDPENWERVRDLIEAQKNASHQVNDVLKNAPNYGKLPAGAEVPGYGIYEDGRDPFFTEEVLAAEEALGAKNQVEAAIGMEAIANGSSDYMEIDDLLTTGSLSESAKKTGTEAISEVKSEETE